MSVCNSINWRARRATSANATRFSFRFAPETLATLASKPSSVLEFLHQLRGGFQTNSRHAGNVVDGVARQRQQVDDLIGANPPIRFEGGRIEHFLFAKVENADMIIQKLAGVFVGGANINVEVAFLGAAGERGDDVVGFKALKHQHRDVERLERAADDVDLRRRDPPAWRRVEPCIRERYRSERLCPAPSKAAAR